MPLFGIRDESAMACGSGVLPEVSNPEVSNNVVGPRAFCRVFAGLQASRERVLLLAIRSGIGRDTQFRRLVKLLPEVQDPRSSFVPFQRPI